MLPVAPKSRILVVEDEPIVSRDLQLQLLHLGYDAVGSATRGDHAIALTGELLPDLVLMDINLEGPMDGIATAQCIRDQFAIPIVFITAFGEDEVIARAKLTEPFGYIIKPFSERELRSVIEMALYKKQTEAKLQQSEERLRLVLLGARDGVWDRDLVKQTVFYSARWWEIIGYAPDELPATPELWLNLTHPDDRARCEQFIEQVKSSATRHYEFEARLRHKAGHYVPIVSRGLVVRNPDGRATRLAGTNTDLTLRKAAEAKLQRRTDFLAGLGDIVRDLLRHRDSADLLSATVAHAAKIFTAAQAMIFVKEGDVLVTRATWHPDSGSVPSIALLPKNNSEPAWIAFTSGQPRQTQIGALAPGQSQPPQMIIGSTVLHVPLSLGSEHLGVLALMRPEGIFSEEEIAEAKQLADAFALILHNAQLLTDLREDMRRREHAEQKNKESELRLSSIVNSAMDAIITVDARQQILIFNPAAEALFGLPRAQAVGQPLDRFIPTRFRAAHRRQVENFSASKHAMAFGRTVHGLRADGQEFPLEASISHVKVGNESLYTVFLRDVSARERAEREKESIEAQLRQSQKLEAIGQLAGGIAHDFNNLLTAILGNAALLQSNNPLPAGPTEMLQQITQAGNRAASLTRQLLLFSRREEPVRNDLDLNHSVAEMLKMLRRILGENINLQIDFAPEPQFVHADAGMIDQILLNLAVNARDAMPQGGKLTVTTDSVVFELVPETNELTEWLGPERRPRQRPTGSEAPFGGALNPAVSTASAGEFTCLSVIDEGSGMPPEVLAHIFEPFFTTKEASRGTGLGLATVYGIVQLHHGWIEVVSKPGAGSTFRVYLPRLLDPPVPEAVDATPKPSVTGHGETILLVEDESSVRSLLRILLEKAGYRVLECISGATALELWPKHRTEVRLLITDMVMPGALGGIQLAQKLLKDRPDLRIIVVSGYSATLSKDRAKFDIGIDFIPKPFDLDKVLAIVRARLDTPNAPRI